MAVLLGERILGLIPPDGHDHRLFVTPGELGAHRPAPATAPIRPPRAAQAAAPGLRLEPPHELAPSARGALAMLLFQLGLVSLADLLGVAGPAPFGVGAPQPVLPHSELLVSYIGAAVAV